MSGYTGYGIFGTLSEYFRIQVKIWIVCYESNVPKKAIGHV